MKAYPQSHPWRRMVVFNNWYYWGTYQQWQAPQILEWSEEEVVDWRICWSVRKNRTVENEVAGRENASYRLCKYRDHVPYHPIHPLAKSCLEV